MFSLYFGNYLLSKKLISIEQYKSVMDLQNHSCIKVGILAVDLGLLTAAEVEEIHHMQTRMDKRFGELAIEMGYLTVEQLRQILAEQETTHLRLSQALIDQGILTMQQFEDALRDYKRDYSLSDIQLKAIQNGDIDEIVRTYINLDGISQVKLYLDYISLFTRNIIRFISSDIRIEGFAVEAPYQSSHMMIQNIMGEISLITGMDASEDTFLKFASKFAGEELCKLDELTIESFGEFLNLHNGIFTVNESDLGREYDLTPQTLLEAEELSPPEETVGVKIHLPYGTVNLIIGRV